MRLLEAAREEANPRLIFCDLNWTRLVHVRLALAQFFDPPGARECLANVRQVQIGFAPNYRSTAILLVGWLAAQLGWTLLEAPDETTIGFSDGAGETVRIVLEQTEGEPINRCCLMSESKEFCVEHSRSTEFLDLTTRSEDGAPHHQLMPAGRNDLVSLMGEELMRGGPHRVYLRAVKAVRELF
jgi:glucose-6-phosphate dehydrogenase assembly protein OpcA